MHGERLELEGGKNAAAKPGRPSLRERCAQVRLALPACDIVQDRVLPQRKSHDKNAEKIKLKSLG
jgi:hypothetical protein